MNVATGLRFENREYEARFVKIRLSPRKRVRDPTSRMEESATYLQVHFDGRAIPVFLRLSFNRKASDHVQLLLADRRRV